jgi:hypothetical protein
MNVPLWNSVDQFYITTYEGSPRIEKLNIELKKWNIPDSKITWNIPKKLHCDNCTIASATKNHIEVYAHAKENGYANIFVLEDDIIVYDHAKTIPIINEKTEYFIKNYPNYDILYYGYIPYYIEKILDPDFVKMYGLLQHAYLINEKFYSKFLNIVDTALLCDLVFIPWRAPIDVAVWSLQVKYQNSYGVYPQLIYQDNSPIFKKGNNYSTFMKVSTDILTDCVYNADIITTFLPILILILIIGKIK